MIQAFFRSAIATMSPRKPPLPTRIAKPPSTRTRAATERLQLLLLTRGFPPGPIDGILGEKTERAVLRAAKAAGLDHPKPAAIVAWLRQSSALAVLVPRLSTPVPIKDLVPALQEGHERVFGEELDEARLRMAHAHLLVEHGPISQTDRGLRAVHTYNLGNVMTGKGYLGPWFEMTALERDRYGRMVPRKSQWRASAEASEGAFRYWDMLQTHFQHALAVMGGGDPARFAHELRGSGYYTAREQDYALLLMSCWRMLGA